MHRWAACPGSVRLCADLPDEPSAAAREGTRAHALGEQILRYWLKTCEPERGLRARFREGTTIRWTIEPKEYNKKAITELWNIEQDTLDNVMVYVNEVTRLAGQNKKAEVYLEERVSLEHIRPDMWGTLDAAVLSPECLSVIDYKNGFMPVRLRTDVERLDDPPLTGVNPQLLFYAAGAIAKFKWNGNVTLSIVQPRSMEVEPVQAIGLSSAEINNWAENYLWERACATDMANAPLAAGEHCRFCPAAGTCPELARKSLGEVSLDFESVVDDKQLILYNPIMVPMDAKKLSRVLKIAPMVDAWLRECEVAAQALMQRGEKVDGFKLVRKKSNRVWPTEDPKVLLKLLKKAGQPKLTEDMLTKTEILSPAQFEKKWKNKEVVAAVATKPDNGLTIAAASDRREAVNPAGDFEDIL